MNHLAIIVAAITMISGLATAQPGIHETRIQEIHLAYFPPDTSIGEMANRLAEKVPALDERVIAWGFTTLMYSFNRHELALSHSQHAWSISGKNRQQPIFIEHRFNDQLGIWRYGNPFTRVVRQLEATPLKELPRESTTAHFISWLSMQQLLEMQAEAERLAP